jgi:L-lactate dehydrogenase
MKIGVVGTGFVGATAAYAIVMRGVGRELVLVDVNRARAEAEADDIRHAVPFAHPLEVRAGDYADLAGARAVVLCAGVNQKPGETRLQLLQKNAGIFGDVVPKIVAAAPHAVLIVATNPVDVMTHVAVAHAAAAGIAPGRVFGSGTTLDSARFRSLLGAHCGVDPHHVHAQVLGEHGDSEVLAWSTATIGGVPLEQFAHLRDVPFTPELREEIDRKVRRAAYTIISGKGATYYGVGSALARIADVVLHDQRSVLTVTLPTPDVAGVGNVSVSLPRLVGGAGVLDTFPPNINADEMEKLRASAAIIRKALDELGLA